MTLQLGKVHEYSKVNDGGPPVLTKVDPVTRISCREKGIDPINVFIQHGAFYSEDGLVIKEGNLPHWLDREIKKMTQKAREEVGLKDWKPGQLKLAPKQVPPEEDEE